METKLTVIVGLVAAVLAGYVVAAAEPNAEPAFKGMELYSWKPVGEDWYFSLLVGTNREKSEEEIKTPENTIVGWEALKKRLEQLAAGEQVFWRNLAQEAVPEARVQELKSFCAGIKVSLEQL